MTMQAAASRRQLSPQRAKWWLLLIVLLGASLRFTRLGFPPALTDEAFTYWRICGSLGQMFDTLRLDAFVPLHYELLWVLTKLLGPELWVMRLPSAICAALMPLAIYRLCRIMLGRRTAILAALFAAASAYFSFYGRDAKMYMPAWLLTTLATAAAMGFARTGKRLSWLQFVLFGTAAAGVHSLTLIPLTLVPLASIGLARWRAVRKVCLIVAGLALIGVGPAIYYLTFNRWFTVSGGLSGVPASTVKEPAHDNGLMWVKEWQKGLDAPDTLIESLAAFSVGYEYQPTPAVRSAGGNWGAYEGAYLFKSALIMLLFVAGVAILFSIFRRSSRNRIGLFWAGFVLLVLPLYAFYLRSFTTLLPPWDIVHWSISLAAIVVCFLLLRRGARWLLQASIWIGAALGLLTIAWLTAKTAYALAPRLADGTPAWNPLWMPRYAAIVAPMLMILLAVAFNAVPTRLLRWVAISLFVSVNVAASIARIVFPTAWPDDVLAADAVATIAEPRTLILADWLGSPWERNLFLQMPAPHYNFVRAADLELDPPSFRDGNQWPYRPGAAVRSALSNLRLLSLSTTNLDAHLSEKYDRVIVWRRQGKPGAPPAELPGFTRTAHKEYIIRHAWTWRITRTIDRTEYRVNEGSGLLGTGRNPL
ncbi:MAG: glycosyltransferase family 39 protein [Burkholderiales bacterium]|nr:glycosyltransferase family 39 protein [Phycisphaerae bacterium]